MVTLPYACWKALVSPSQNLIGWSNSLIQRLIDTCFILQGPQNWLWRSPGRFIWHWQQMMAEMWLVKCFNIKIHVWNQRNQGKSYERKRTDYDQSVIQIFLGQQRRFSAQPSCASLRYCWVVFMVTVRPCFESYIEITYVIWYKIYICNSSSSLTVKTEWNYL